MRGEPSSNGHRWDQVALRIAFTSGLTAYERVVLTGLAIEGNWRTGEALSTAPSLQQLADYAGLSRTTVAKTIKQLIDKRWIKETRHRRHKTAMHMINLSRLDTVPTKLAKVPPAVAPEQEEVDDPGEESVIRTANGKESATETPNPVSSPQYGFQEAVKESVLRTISTDRSTEDPYTERSDPEKFPDQEPALRASPPPDNSKHDENPKAKPTPPFVDFEMLRAKLHQPAPPVMSHRDRVAAARKAAHA
jgi:DNA-binding transcriptional MocR family regulator